jgi:hypothetical protein
MPPRLRYILLAQNHGSKDNKACTCKFDGDGDLKKPNSACPVQGHRYLCQTLLSRFRRNAFSKASPQQLHRCTRVVGRLNRSVTDKYRRNGRGMFSAVVGVTGSGYERGLDVVSDRIMEAFGQNL